MLPISNVSDASHDRVFINAMLQYLDHLKYYLHDFFINSFCLSTLPFALAKQHHIKNHKKISCQM